MARRPATPIRLSDPMYFADRRMCVSVCCEWRELGWNRTVDVPWGLDALGGALTEASVPPNADALTSKVPAGPILQESSFMIRSTPSSNGDSATLIAV